MDVTHIPELVNKTGYPVMMQAFEAVPGVRHLIADVRDIPADHRYGTKGTTIIGGSRLEKRDDSQGFAQDRLEKGYTYQVGFNSYGKELRMDRRFVEAATEGEIGNILSEWAASQGRNSAYQREEGLADMLQKGTLTAGDTSVFDNSFPGNDDPYPGFIYDGKPLFATDHPIIVGSGTYSNYTESLALNSANLTTAKVLMQQTSAVDDRGERILNRVEGIIVPPSMEATAKVLLNSQAIPGSANNDMNVHQGSAALIVNPFLTDTASASAWWLKMSTPGIVWYEQVGGPKFRVYEHEPTNEVVIQVVDEWGGAAKNWRGLAAFNKAS